MNALKWKEIITVCILVSISFVLGNILNWQESHFGVLNSAHPKTIKEELPVIKNTETEGKININTATKEELCSLEGIGEKYAERIIHYREKNGRFNVIHDIMKVNGVGLSRFNKIKDEICV